MVLGHTFRQARGMMKGAVMTKPLDVYQVCSANVFCGLRLVDAFGHVNNAKYLEILDLARWQHGVGPWYSSFYQAGVAPICSGAQLTYLSEIKPWTVVRCTSQLAYADEKNVFLYEEITSTSSPGSKMGGATKIHAAGVVKLAFLPLLKPKHSVEKWLVENPEAAAAAATTMPLADVKGNVIHESHPMDASTATTNNNEEEEQNEKKKKVHPKKKRLTPAEYYFRCGLSSTPLELPERVLERNREFAEYFLNINQGEDSWRKALRSRQDQLVQEHKEKNIAQKAIASKQPAV